MWLARSYLYVGVWLRVQWFLFACAMCERDVRVRFLCAKSSDVRQLVPTNAAPAIILPSNLLIFHGMSKYFPQSLDMLASLWLMGWQASHRKQRSDAPGTGEAGIKA